MCTGTVIIHGIFPWKHNSYYWIFPYGKPEDEISILKKLRQDVWDFPEVPAEGWLVFFCITSSIEKGRSCCLKKVGHCRALQGLEMGLSSLRIMIVLVILADLWWV